MARKKSIYTPITVTPRIGVHKRIVLPKRPARTFRFSPGAMLRKELIHPEPSWMIVHRRGLRRRYVGISSLEARASQSVSGSLPERILYKALVDRLHFVAGIDFLFQSSTDGGRLDLGGLVADFTFPLFKFAIRVMSVFHDDFIHGKHDAEELDELANYGYRVFDVRDTLIYDEYLFEEWLRRTFNLSNGMAGDGGSMGTHDVVDRDDLLNVYNLAMQLRDSVDRLTLEARRG